MGSNIAADAAAICKKKTGCFMFFFISVFFLRLVVMGLWTAVWPWLCGLWVFGFQPSVFGLCGLVFAVCFRSVVFCFRSPEFVPLRSSFLGVSFVLIVLGSSL